MGSGFNRGHDWVSAGWDFENPPARATVAEGEGRPAKRLAINAPVVPLRAKRGRR